MRDHFIYRAFIWVYDLDNSERHKETKEIFDLEPFPGVSTLAHKLIEWDRRGWDSEPEIIMDEQPIPQN